MDSKVTKVTRRSHIAKPSQSMVLRESIAKLLAECASSCPQSDQPCDSSLKRPLTRGELTEKNAAKWLVARGDRIVARRFETPFAEVDILALKPCGSLLVCEVKSSFWPDQQALGLGWKQRARLSRATAWIASESARDVEIVLLGPSTQSGQFEEIPIF